MSYVTGTPEMLAAAASDVASYRLVVKQEQFGGCGSDHCGGGCC